MPEATRVLFVILLLLFTRIELVKSGKQFKCLQCVPQKYSLDSIISVLNRSEHMCTTPFTFLFFRCRSLSFLLILAFVVSDSVFFSFGISLVFALVFSNFCFRIEILFGLSVKLLINIVNNVRSSKQHLATQTMVKFEIVFELVFAIPNSNNNEMSTSIHLKLFKFTF